jgi:hypothetical protein
MTPEEKLRQLCRRYAVPADEAGDLLPLVQRGLGTPGTVGRCLLAVVEAALATRGAGTQAGQRERLDDRVLVALAGVLHDWEP